METLGDGLDEEELPDTMDDSLEADIAEGIPKNMSEMCGGAILLGILPHTIR